MRNKSQRSRLPPRFTIPNEQKPDLVQKCLEIDKERYAAYKGPCMIPPLDSDGFSETGVMSDCHVIGGRFLGLIARGGNLLAWPFNGRQIGLALLPAQWTFTGTIQPELESLRPERYGINDYACTSPFACHDHDDLVFKRIDNPTTFDALDEESQFLLAFRGIAGAAAIAKGTLTHLEDKKKEMFPRRVRRQNNNRYKFAVKQSKYLEDSLNLSQTRARLLDTELKNWQDMYVADGKRSIVSWQMTCITNIRLAISVVTHQQGAVPVTVSVLPKIVGDSDRTLCDIILTSRNNQQLGSYVLGQDDQLDRQIAQLRQFAAEIADNLSGDPSLGLPELVKYLSLNPTSFFFVSPDDYRTINEISRAHIEKEMAVIAGAFLSP